MSLIVAAGGTGGHLFPARALAEEMTRRGYRVDLVTEQRGERYGKGFPACQVHYVPSATLASHSPLAIAKTLCTLVQGTAVAWALMRRTRPAAIVGFGGYPTLPPLIAAKLAGVPVAIHEQNAVMGRANRVLAHLARSIALSWEATNLVPRSAWSRTHVTGAPVRDAVQEWSAQSYSAPTARGAVRLLIFGGSQGAQFFADCVPMAVSSLPQPLKSRLKIVQQCRPEDLERVRFTYGEFGIEAELASFFDNLPERIAKAHLVIARSGASTVAELAVIGRPSILVPLPDALDNDQLENATRLQQSGGAHFYHQADLTPERLTDEIAALLSAPRRLEQAAVSARAFGRCDAVGQLSDLVETLISSRRGDKR